MKSLLTKMSKFPCKCAKRLSGLLTIWWTRCRHAEEPAREVARVVRILGQKNVENRVLLFEGNPYHGETLCGYAKYFIELGFSIDIVANCIIQKENPFCRFHENTVGIHFMKMSGRALTIFFSNPILMRYKCVFVSSTMVYINDGVYCIPNMLAHQRNKTFFVEHDLLNVDNKYPVALVQQGKVFTLANRVSENYCTRMVNPHYFGSTKLSPPPQDFTNFLGIGVIHEGYKSHYTLINEIEQCKKSAGDKFTVTLIGHGKADYLSAIDRVNFLGRVDFATMFHAVEQSNFLLFMLDPDNPAHERYIFNQATGSLQLAFGFGIVPVVCKKFAKAFGLTSEMAVIYDDSVKTSGLTEAVRLTANEYRCKQNALMEHAQKQRLLSLEHLKNALKLHSRADLLPRTHE